MLEVQVRRSRWPKVAFGDVVRLSAERSRDPVADGIDRFVGLDHIDPGDLRTRRWGYVADGTTFTNVFRPGQVLFGKRRAYQRKVAVADFSGVCSGDIYVLEPKSPHLAAEVLPYICQTDAFFSHAIGTSAGSLSPRTNWRSLASFEFALPPLDEQVRIASTLAAIDKATYGLGDLLKALETLQGSFLQETFLAETQCVAALSRLVDVTTRIGDGTHQAPTFVPSGVPFLFVSNITSGRIDWETKKYVSDQEFERLTRNLRPQKGDLLYSLVGSYGSPAIVDVDRDFTFQRHIGIIRTHEARLLSKYLYWFLVSPPGKQQAHMRAEGLAQKTITLTALRGFQIPCPPVTHQRDVIESCERIEARRQEASARWDEAMHLRGLALLSLMDGEL